MKKRLAANIMILAVLFAAGCAADRTDKNGRVCGGPDG
jgi:hypothetical protein